MLKPERQAHENLAFDEKAATISIVIALALMVFLAFQSFGNTLLLFGVGGGIGAVFATGVIWWAANKSQELVSREDDKSEIFETIHDFQSAWWPCAATSGLFLFLGLLTVSIGTDGFFGVLFGFISLVAGIINFFTTLGVYTLNHRRIGAAFAISRQQQRSASRTTTTALPVPAHAGNVTSPAPAAQATISPSAPPQRPRGVRSVDEIAAGHIRAATLKDYRDDVKLQTEILDAETAAVHSQVERERAFLRNDKRDFVLRTDQARLEKEALSAEARLRELQTDEREADLARRTREQEVTKVEAKLEGRALEEPSDDDEDVRDFLAEMRPERYGSKRDKLLAALHREKEKMVREFGGEENLTDDQRRMVEDFHARGLQKIEDSFPEERPARHQMRS